MKPKRPTPNTTPNADQPISQTHDKFFKAIFTKKEAVAEFIEKLLPQEIATHIDLDSLVLDNSSYVDDKLKSHCSDVVYDCRYLVKADALGKDNHNAVAVKVALLFEHKSYPEKYPHLQLLRYLLNSWETQLKQKQALKPVIPIIFYHGKGRWQYKPLVDYFVDTDVYLDDNLKRFLPSFDYVLLDTSQYDNQDFKQLSQAELQYGILAMKHIFNMAQFFANISEILADIDTFLTKEQGRKFFKTMVVYLYQYTNLTYEQWEEKMQSVSPRAKKHFVSTYDQAIATGMQRGMERGMQRGMQQATLATAKNLKAMGLTIQTIAQATGLSVAEVERL